MASLSTLRVKEQIFSPYYIRSIEYPAIYQLDEKNFHEWKRAVTDALKMKNKLQFVDRTLRMPDKSEILLRAQDTCNTLVLTQIRNSISSSISKSVLWIEIAHEVWKDLDHRFSQQDVFLWAVIQEEIALLK